MDSYGIRILYISFSNQHPYLRSSFMEIIHFTEAALQAIKRYQENLQIPENYYLRIGIRQKNESNKRLLIGFDAKTEKDRLQSVQGLDIIYSPGEVFFFAGMAIDYVEEDQRKGFTFVEHKQLAI